VQKFIYLLCSENTAILNAIGKFIMNYICNEKLVWLQIQKQFCHYNIQQGTNFIYLDMYIFRLMNSLQRYLKPKRLKIQIIFIFIISLSAHIEAYLIKLKVMPFFWVLLQTLEYYFNSRVTLFRGIWIYRPSWAGFNSLQMKDLFRKLWTDIWQQQGRPQQTAFM
jgi:hypothetical protein